MGYVDFLYLINQHPDTATGLSDTDKQNLARQLDQRVEQKRQELLRPIAAKVTAAAYEVTGCPSSLGKTKPSAAWTSPPMF